VAITVQALRPGDGNAQTVDANTQHSAKLMKVQCDA
jgi:hypothetical protein